MTALIELGVSLFAVVAIGALSALIAILEAISRILGFFLPH